MATMRRVSWIVSLATLLFLAASTAAAQPVPDEPCAAEYPDAADPAITDGPGDLTVRLRVTGADVDGRICLLTGADALVDEHRGPFEGNHETVVGWGLVPGNFTVVFNQTNSPMWVAGSRAVDLDRCLEGAATVWINVTYLPGLMVAFSAGSACTYGPRIGGGSNGSGNTTDDNATGSPDPPQNGTAGQEPPISDPTSEEVAEERTDVEADGSGVTGRGGGGVFAFGGEFVPATPEAVAVGFVAGSVLLTAFVVVHYGPGLTFLAASLLGRRLVGSAEDHPVRERILDLVKAEPGIHANAIRRHLELGSGQTMHHLGILVNHRLLEASGPGGFRRFFPARRFGVHEKRAIAALRRRHALAVYERLAARPDCALKDVARDVEISPSVVTKVVKQLRHADLVEGEAGRGTLRARPLPPAVGNALSRPGTFPPLTNSDK